MALRKKAVEPATAPEAPLLQVTSRETGRNAQVLVYTNRVERRKERSRATLSRAAQETETTPMRAISSVQVVKDGFKSKVILHASGNPIELRVTHAEAAQVRDLINSLLLQETSLPAASSHLDDLGKLHELYSAGALSDDEFAAQKSLLLSRV